MARQLARSRKALPSSLVLGRGEGASSRGRACVGSVLCHARDDASYARFPRTTHLGNVRFENGLPLLERAAILEVRESRHRRHDVLCMWSPDRANVRSVGGVEMYDRGADRMPKVRKGGDACVRACVFVCVFASAKKIAMPNDRAAGTDCKSLALYQTELTRSK